MLIHTGTMDWTNLQNIKENENVFLSFCLFFKTFFRVNDIRTKHRVMQKNK